MCWSGPWAIAPRVAASAAGSHLEQRGRPLNLVVRRYANNRLRSFDRGVASLLREMREHRGFGERADRRRINSTETYSRRTDCRLIYRLQDSAERDRLRRS